MSSLTPRIVITTLLLTLWPQTLSSSYSPRFVIWNVGQGLWTTLITDRSCFHFDMGGEKVTGQSRELQHCRKKKNYVSITHGDWDDPSRRA